MKDCMDKPLYNFLPSDVDLTKGLSSTFGMYEFEQAAIEIIKYLQKDNGWDKCFAPSLFKFDVDIFAMMCCCRWIVWDDPMKYRFKVGSLLIERLYEKSKWKQ